MKTAEKKPLTAEEIKSKNWIEREKLAKDPNTSIGVLRVLADDENYYVRADVAENPNTTKGLLRVLIEDKYASVREKAFRRLYEMGISSQEARAIKPEY